MTPQYDQYDPILEHLASNVCWILRGMDVPHTKEAVRELTDAAMLYWVGVRRIGVNTIDIAQHFRQRAQTKHTLTFQPLLLRVQTKLAAAQQRKRP